MMPPPGALAAASVHLFTALGAVCGLMAALAALDDDFRLMFIWLGVALVIDAIDGTFARMVHVSERLPRFSGERLDLVVDYVTYVFVPALALLQAGYLSGASGTTLAALILISSLYHFSDTGSKGEDYSFVGFPAIWNIVAFYVFALALPSWLAYALVTACVLLTFVPMRWGHPLRVAYLRRTTIIVTAAWTVAAIASVWTGFPAPLWCQAILVAALIYTVGLTVILTFRRGPFH